MTKRRLTKREREQRAKTMKYLRDKGLVDPPKKRLNREKFLEEAEKTWNERPKCYVWEWYLVRACEIVMAQQEPWKPGQKKPRHSLEAIGAAKVLMCAVRLQEHNERHRAEGTQPKIGETLDALKDILEA